MHLAISLIVYILITCISVKLVSLKREVTVSMILVISLLFTLYNVIVTEMSLGLGGDRFNYYMNYLGVRDAGSTGLMLVIIVLRKLSANYEFLLYFSTFACMVLTLSAYKISEVKSANVLLFLLTTQYALFTLTGIKQSYANGFACLCLVIALKHKNKWDTISCIFLIMLAILFHPTGYLLIPLFLMVRIHKTPHLVFFSFFIMTLMAVFIEPIMINGARALMPIAPNLALTISRYFGTTAIEELQTEGYMTILKGIPYFLITFIGIRWRHRLKEKIEGYNSYLLLCTALSFIYVFTIYNSWLYRLAYYLYLPAGLFFVQMMSHERNRGNYYIINSCVIGFNALITLRFIVLIYVNYGGF